MTLLLDLPRVQYQCTCGIWNTLSREYFCRHCTEVHCFHCVSHEVDSIFCPHCLENMPSAEARHKRNRCSNCYVCPCCCNHLNVRATSAGPGGESLSPSVADGSGNASDTGSTKPLTKKVYYLACAFCRWTSRDCGAQDALASAGPWPEHEVSTDVLAQFNAVLEHFHNLAAAEKAERERRRFTSKSRRSLLPWTDRYGMPALMQRKKMMAAGVEVSGDEGGAAGSGTTFVTEPSDDAVEPLSERYMTEPLNLNQQANIAQRHSLPYGQPERVHDLYPIRQRLAIKRSQRCKKCDHNLCKAEYSPNSIKFKIQLSAMYHVPDVRILMPPKLVANEPSVVFLTMSNFSAQMTHVVFLPDVDAPDESCVVQVPDLPACDFTLPMRDETAEFDDQQPVTKPSVYGDDSSVVMFRKGHRIAVKLEVIPKSYDGDHWLHFTMKFDYINTLLSLTNESEKPPEPIWMTQRVKINVGKLFQEE